MAPLWGAMTIPQVFWEGGLGETLFSQKKVSPKMLTLQKIDQYRWQLPRQGGMRTEGIVYADQGLLRGMDQGVLAQLEGVASLPGIVGPALAMPDAHQGYGFPIGGGGGL